MNIEKAIEILSQYLKQGCIMSTQDLHDSIALGIETLKAIDSIRKHHPLYTAALLPGETIEP